MRAPLDMHPFFSEGAGACASGFDQIYAHVRQKLAGLSELAKERGEAARADYRDGVFRLPPRPACVAPNGIELLPVLDVDFP